MPIKNPPPRLPERLMERVLISAAQLNGVIGDLREEYQHRRSRRGRLACDLWYWRQAFLVFFRFGWKVRKGRLSDFFRDFLYSARILKRKPGFAAGVVLSLSLGIGANVTMFEIVDRLLLSPPRHVEDPQEIRRAYLRASFYSQIHTSAGGFTYSDFLDLTTVESFSTVAAYSTISSVTLGSAANAERVKATIASWEFFPLLGVTPVIGRFYTREEDRIGEPITAVLGYGLWQRRYGGDPSIVGRTLDLWGNQVLVLGVAPEGFTGVDLERVDVWLSLRPTKTHQTGTQDWPQVMSTWANIVARMRPDASQEAAAEQAMTLHRRAREELIAAGDYDPQARILLGSVIAARGPRTGPDGVGGATEGTVALWLSGVSLLVLLISCANVANLVLARAVDRRRESAIRLAIGVSRIRLVAQMTMEVVVLAAVGGLAALLLSRWAGALVRQALLSDVHWVGSTLDARILLFVLLVCVLAGLLAGLLPALQATELNVVGALGGGGRTQTVSNSRIHRGLLAFQAALSVLLLVGAGLFLKSLERAHQKDLGLEVDQVARLTLEFEEGEVDGAETNRRYQMVANRLALLPEIAHVTINSSSFRWCLGARLSVPGVDSIPTLPGGGPCAQRVDAAYFQTMGINILEGRPLTTDDLRQGAAVTVISETTARILWPGESPLGKCVRFGGQDASCTSVVGVVEDTSRGRIQELAYARLYLPLDLSLGTPTARVAYVRFRNEPREILALLRREVVESAPGIRYVEVISLREMFYPEIRSWDLGATLFSAFGIVALVVASVGLYSVLAYSVARRTREFGIRTALGATWASVFRLVVRDGILTSTIGLLSGIALALLSGKWLEPLLFEVSPHDPLVFFAVSLTILFVSVVAGLRPAWKACRIDGVAALKTD